MVAEISVRADFSAVERLAASLSQRAPGVLKKAVLKGAQLAVGEIRARLNESTEGRGGLARSFQARFISDAGDVVSAEAYSTLVYAGVQNEGGVIRAKSRLLAVPIKRANIAPGKWPRHFPQSGPQKLHLIPRRGRGGLLVQKRGRGKNERIIPMFSLRESVTIRPQHYVEAAQAKIAPTIEKVLGDAFEDILRGGER